MYMVVVYLLSLCIACIVEQYVWLSSLGLSAVRDWHNHHILARAFHVVPPYDIIFCVVTSRDIIICVNTDLVASYDVNLIGAMLLWLLLAFVEAFLL